MPSPGTSEKYPVWVKSGSGEFPAQRRMISTAIIFSSASEISVCPIKADLTGANALCGKGDVFIHGFPISFLIQSCTQVGYIV